MNDVVIISRAFYLKLVCTSVQYRYLHTFSNSAVHLGCQGENRFYLDQGHKLGYQVGQAERWNGDCTTPWEHYQRLGYLGTVRSGACLEANGLGSQLPARSCPAEMQRTWSRGGKRDHKVYATKVCATTGPSQGHRY
jgi:hypothetical protein